MGYPAMWAWTCLSPATLGMLSGVGRHPKVPMPVESSGVASGTKVPADPAAKLAVARRAEGWVADG